MRNNLPVTQQEYAYPESMSLVSTTDLDSHITYCNPAFIEVSGYDRDELIGQPHNLIRHPDMPPEAFRDMWETIKGGRPWSAMVKNRRKNGDHYWVLANVTPLLRDGAPIGFMSVRTHPKREQVDAAEKLYAGMRAEAEAGARITVLDSGRVRRRTLNGRIATWLEVSTRKMVLIGTIGPSLTMALLGLWLGGVPLFGGEGLAVLIGATVLGYGGSGLVRLYAFQPLRRLMDQAFAIAAGDLTQTVPVDRVDDIGNVQRAINQLNVNLRTIVGDIRQGVEGIGVASSEISTGNADLSVRTQSQAASVEETAATMEQISSTVAGSAETARHVASLSRDATQQSRRSGETVDGLVAQIKAISDSSGEITRIIEVIDSIAFQTNILALNAAVEAARAGEQGRGFAVVAAEVRSLAQRTIDASAQVKSIIEDSRGKIESGNELARAAGESLAGTLQAVRSVHELIDQISSGAGEQSDGVTQVNVAVSQIDQITQQNASLVEELSAVAESLRDQADAVAASVSVFQLR